MITANKARCRKCGDVIESFHRHDYKHCKCGSISVDGGKAYIRRGWPSGDWKDWIEELSEEMPHPKERLIQERIEADKEK